MSIGERPTCDVDAQSHRVLCQSRRSMVLPLPQILSDAHPRHPREGALVNPGVNGF